MGRRRAGPRDPDRQHLDADPRSQRKHDRGGRPRGLLPAAGRLWAFRSTGDLRFAPPALGHDRGQLDLPQHRRRIRVHRLPRLVHGRPDGSLAAQLPRVRELSAGLSCRRDLDDEPCLRGQCVQYEHDGRPKLPVWSHVRRGRLSLRRLGAGPQDYVHAAHGHRGMVLRTRAVHEPDRRADAGHVADRAQRRPDRPRRRSRAVVLRLRRVCGCQHAGSHGVQRR